MHEYSLKEYAFATGHGQASQATMKALMNAIWIPLLMKPTSIIQDPLI